MIARLPELAAHHNPIEPGKVPGQLHTFPLSALAHRTVQYFATTWDLFNLCLAHARRDLAVTVLRAFLALPPDYAAADHRRLFIDVLNVLRMFLARANVPVAGFGHVFRAATISHILPALGPRPLPPAPLQHAGARVGTWAKAPLNHACADCMSIGRFLTDGRRREAAWTLDQRRINHIVAMLPPKDVTFFTRPRPTTPAQPLTFTITKAIAQPSEAARWEHDRADTEKAVAVWEPLLGYPRIIVMAAISPNGPGWTPKIAKAARELGAKIKVKQVLEVPETRDFLRDFALRSALCVKPAPAPVAVANGARPLPPKNKVRPPNGFVVTTDQPVGFPPQRIEEQDSPAVSTSSTQNKSQLPPAPSPSPLQRQMQLPSSPSSFSTSSSFSSSLDESSSSSGGVSSTRGIYGGGPLGSRTNMRAPPPPYRGTPSVAGKRKAAPFIGIDKENYSGSSSSGSSSSQAKRLCTAISFKDIPTIDLTGD